MLFYLVVVLRFTYFKIFIFASNIILKLLMSGDEKKKTKKKKKNKKKNCTGIYIFGWRCSGSGVRFTSFPKDGSPFVIFNLKYN